MAGVYRACAAALLIAGAAEGKMHRQLEIGTSEKNVAKEYTMQQLPEKLRLIAFQHLNADDRRWWVRDVTASYGKLEVERLFWIIDSEDHSITLAQCRNGEFYLLSGPQGLALSSELLVKAYGNEPWRTLGVEKLGKIIMSWHSDPRAYIATESFFQKQRPVLKSWLTKREKDASALLSVCRDPILTQDGIHWNLDFNAINRRGGVEHWIIKGDATNFMIKDVTITTVKPDGTFNFPDEL